MPSDYRAAAFFLLWFPSSLCGFVAARPSNWGLPLFGTRWPSCGASARDVRGYSARTGSPGCGFTGFKIRTLIRQMSVANPVAAQNSEMLRKYSDYPAAALPSSA
jgi:hypothetical protein